MTQNKDSKTLDKLFTIMYSLSVHVFINVKVTMCLLCWIVEGDVFVLLRLNCFPAYSLCLNYCCVM